MTKFKYTGKTIDNKLVRGVLEAADETMFLARTRGEGIYLQSYKALDESPSTLYRMKALDLSEFSRQVGNMLSAGIPIFRAMSIMKENELRKKVRDVYEKLYQTIQDGNTLAAAMELSGGSFPPLIINMFRAGEASGQLDKSALKMADYYDKEHKLYNKVKNAMTYPIFLLFLTFTVVMVIFTVVLPNFFDLFTNVELPLITKVVLGISQFMQYHWYYVIIGMLLFLFMALTLSRISSAATWLDRQRLGIPLVGNLLRVIYTARFARTLSSLYSSGLSMLDAVRISSSIVGNRYVASQFDEVIRRIRSGEALSTAITDINGFNSKLQATILVGEETGKLDSMLNSIADAFDFEAENATAKMVALIEPVMIVIMAVVIGSIMLAVMLPILSMYQGLHF